MELTGAAVHGFERPRPPPTVLPTPKTNMARDGLAAFSLLWAAQQALILFYTGIASPFDRLQALLVAASALSSGWPPVLCAALAVRIYANCEPWPNAWESHFWCAQTDAALLLSLVAQLLSGSGGGLSISLSNAQRSFALRDANRVVRLNSSFLDHRYSCASPYVAQLLTAYLPDTLSLPLLASLVAAAPCTVALGESVLSLALLAAAAGVGGRGTAVAGVCLALLLHFGIALTPPPNNVGAFSVLMACRLAAFAPPEALARAASLPRSASEAATSSGGDGSGAAAGEVGQMSIMFAAGVDWSVPTFVLLAGVVLRGVAGGVASRGVASAAAASPSAAAASAGSGASGSIMYSNLRVVGGSNHLLLPTNLLRLTGAVVRLRTGDFSSVFSPRAVALLRASGHSGRQFNFAMGRALPPPPARFVRYTARGAGEAFALEYSVLAGPEGDEAWRGSSAGVRRVSVSEDPARGVAECVVVSAEGRPSGAACEDGELARLPPLRAWERVWGVWNPHPIIPGLSEEMHCSE
ncbi:hypothetical protein EMIHUDRAFT_204043 [Emiliania huxleyi CCMP1516]|uniref:HTTM domain-containing protein n=2 Tax=Emiliania huxleyi TaxID=2903 RepID=A0A0D3K0V3_EMIH1|nr:hypothetical protein EMIHUDRAFT_204043 [Emiliania huxleyi CCMP1516]EOD29388.1 hypothetical protein EMIHUDRAFT_204043 [Emiliania huxleyi CCMP1516]|eukprot:XP_005781817.1 hypothetical protein EMIHUDRAFT_204043 [Emiliania huxleyi CCMP1516]